jgi:hypothetical protein
MQRGRAGKDRRRNPREATQPCAVAQPTEYSDNYRAVKEAPPSQIRHPDHPDMFTFRTPHTEQSTYQSDHTAKATVHSPLYAPADFAYSRRDVDTTKFRKLERVADVNPLSPKHRPSHAFDATTSYRSNFVNFFPAAAGQAPAKTTTFAEAFPPRTETQEAQPVVLPFDIGTRDPATEVRVNSEYQDHFVDFANQRAVHQKAPVPKPEERTRPLREIWDGARNK